MLGRSKGRGAGTCSGARHERRAWPLFPCLIALFAFCRVSSQRNAPRQAGSSEAIKLQHASHPPHLGSRCASASRPAYRTTLQPGSYSSTDTIISAPIALAMVVRWTPDSGR